MTEQRAGQRDAEYDVFGWLLLAGAAVIGAAAVLPIFVVAAPSYLGIEHGAWRRWPMLVAGGAASALVVALGGHEAYGNTLASLWRHFAHDKAFEATELWALAPLALSGGVLLAPLLHVALHHHNETETTRHRREVSVTRRASLRARRGIGKARFPQPPDRTVLGLPLAGRLPGWTPWIGRRRFVAPQVSVWERQALILGETGSGKTVTALALAGEAARCGHAVYWLDGKADPSARADFLSLMARVGVDARDGATNPLDGWRGGRDAVVNRLLATQFFSEPYYEGIARSVLLRAVGDEPPKSFAELVARLDRQALLRAWRDDPAVTERLRQIPERELYGVRARYEGIAWALGEHLDGTWSYEDVEAAYLPVGRPENRHQAQEVGAFVLEDLLHWALARKPPGQAALVIVDEFSKLSSRPGAAVDLVERARSFGVSLVLIGHTWASLGEDEAVRQRLAGTVGTVIVHQLKQPHAVAALAGTEWVLERTEQVLLDTNTGLGSQRAGNRYVVHPDEIRRLGLGEAFVIAQGLGLKVRVRPVSRG